MKIHQIEIVIFSKYVLFCYLLSIQIENISRVLYAKVEIFKIFVEKKSYAKIEVFKMFIEKKTICKGWNIQNIPWKKNYMERLGYSNYSIKKKLSGTTDWGYNGSGTSV